MCRWRLLYSCPLLSHTRHAMPMDTTRLSHTSVYIVRHARTEENAQRIIQGHLDTSLNSDGEREADIVAKALKHIPFDACYSSDLQRATGTAKRILVHHSGVELQTHIAVRERVGRDRHTVLGAK